MFCFIHILAAMTLQDIVAKHIAALGGADKIHAIHSFVKHG